MFQGESAEGLPGPPGKAGEPGDRVGHTFTCIHTCYCEMKDILK